MPCAFLFSMQQFFFGCFLGIAAQQQLQQLGALLVVQHGAFGQQLGDDELLLLVLQMGNGGVLGINGSAVSAWPRRCGAPGLRGGGECLPSWSIAPPRNGVSSAAQRVRCSGCERQVFGQVQAGRWGPLGGARSQCGDNSRLSANEVNGRGTEPGKGFMVDSFMVGLW